MTQDAILHMRISGEIVDLLDEIRRHEKDLPSRSEMVRRLIVERGKALTKKPHRQHAEPVKA